MVLTRMPLNDGVPGSMPPIPELQRLTGPMDQEALYLIMENEGPPPKILATFASMNTDEVVLMMFTMIWLLRGRNGLLEHDETL